MKHYKVVLEVVFVTLPDGAPNDRHGLFSTFNVAAFTGRHAVDLAKKMFEKRSRDSGLRFVHTGLFTTKCCVHELWEIDHDLSTVDDNGKGFTLFSLGFLASIITLLRFWRLGLTAPHLMVTHNDDQFFH